ncbi:MAG TPA: ABC transporter ATP-binding protein [Acidimicrobiales bacterium]|nr:ABC transporter ATP-binding protein [Acidimicrobiales bacterium]
MSDLDLVASRTRQPPGTETVIDVRDVSKRFRLLRERNSSLKSTIIRGRRTVAEDFWALRDVSFQVHAGETFGLIGENGSGKSTMLKCMTRILTPDRGSIEVQGKVSALLELGAGFHPELSGRENVFLNGAILGMSQRELERRFDDIVDFAGIGKFIDEPVKNYSSGMYVRLGFSVAINVDPDVLLVDEVLAVGDEQFQRKCNEKVSELRKSGKTIVMVTHSMGSVQALCDRVAWFEHGRLIDVGTPKEITDRYLGGVQVDRHVDDGGKPRWGTAEATVTGVHFVDDGGAECSPRSGAPATLRITYETTEPVERPVFAFVVKDLEGRPITGPNGRDGVCIPDRIDGRGHLDVTFDDFVLLPGTYDVDVAIWDEPMLKVYDYRPELLRVDVAPGPITETTGLVSLRGRWSFG